MFGLIVAVKQVYDKYAEDEMTVYAAQVSFFIILSVVPFIKELVLLPEVTITHCPPGSNIRQIRQKRILIIIKRLSTVYELFIAEGIIC